MSPLDSDSYVDKVRNAVSLGGDSDTQVCIAGGIAEAFYGEVSDDIFDKVRANLPIDLWQITEACFQKYRE